MQSMVCVGEKQLVSDFRFSTILLTIERVSPFRDRKGMPLSEDLKNVSLVQRAPLTMPKKKWELASQDNHPSALQMLPALLRLPPESNITQSGMPSSAWQVVFGRVEDGSQTEATSQGSQLSKAGYSSVTVLIPCFPAVYKVNLPFSILV